jgi:hypothetical protein
MYTISPPAAQLANDLAYADFQNEPASHTLTLTSPQHRQLFQTSPSPSRSQSRPPPCSLAPVRRMISPRGRPNAGAATRSDHPVATLHRIRPPSSLKRGVTAALAGTSSEDALAASFSKRMRVVRGAGSGATEGFGDGHASCDYLCAAGNAVPMSP